MINRRSFTFAAAVSAIAAVVPGVSALASVQEEAASTLNLSRPITIIVPFAKGGPTHQMAKLIAGPLAKQLGVAVNVALITGDWGMEGTVAAARSKSDGHTLIMGQMATHAALPILTSNRRYDAVKDFTAIGLVGVSPMVFVVRKDLPVSNLAELSAYLNKRPATLAHGGYGSTSQVAGMQLAAALNTNRLVTKIYAGTAAALDDVAQGKVDVLCEQMVTAMPAIKAGRVKAIGIASTSRNIALPETFTGTQQGFANLRASGWNGLYAPKGLAPALKAKLAGALNSVLEDAATQRQFRELGVHVPFVEQRGPEALAALQAKDMRDLASLFLKSDTRAA